MKKIQVFSLGWLILKELQNYERKLLLCPPQKQAKTQSTFLSAVFHNKVTVCYIKSNTYIQKTKFTSHKEYLFSLLPSRNARKTHADQSIPHAFSLCLKRNNPQTLKVAAAKTLFSSVYVIGTTCYDECFLFSLITGRHCFS